MDLEEQIRSLREQGDLRGAAAKALEGYGPEVLGFLCALLRQEDDAQEVFSQACEDLWTGLAKFEGRSTLRTWFYGLARHAASRRRRSPQHRPGRHTPLTEAGELAERVRSQTLPHLRTSTKDWFAGIREAFPEDDRALLVLRVDREMSWSDIARVFAPGDEQDGTLARMAARLRKQFQLLKDDIRERAQEAGLMPEPER